MSFSSVLNGWIRRGREPVRSLRWRMRRRSDWALVIVLALGLLLVAALLIAQIWRPLPGSSAGDPASLTLATARGAHDRADALVRQWANDAALIRARATWGRATDYAPGTGEWTLLYYSPRRAQTALIAVADGRATLTQESSVEPRLATAPVSLWTVDSPTVFEQVVSQGGDAFLRRHPKALLTLTLGLEASPVWQGTLIDRDTRRTFVIELDAETGQITTIQQSP
ncbi:MAG: hypothetical protein R3300_09500 [Candidatus Promineifilaceae bacterium]|nr:hypothetical protein [Candidatus Promineifilaceae bacterium]